MLQCHHILFKVCVGLGVDSDPLPCFARRYNRIDVDGDENVTLEEFTSGGVFERLKRLHLIARIRRSRLASEAYSVKDILETTVRINGGVVKVVVPANQPSMDEPNIEAVSDEKSRKLALVQQFALGLPGDWERRLYVSCVELS